VRQSAGPAAAITLAVVSRDVLAVSAAGALAVKAAIAIAEHVRSPAIPTSAAPRVPFDLIAPPSRSFDPAW